MLAAAGVMVLLGALAGQPAASGRPEAADLVFADGFDGGLSEAWQAYDNWSKPEFATVQESPIGQGPALRVAMDDKSTLAHFDKGALLRLPEPVPWELVDFISARYHVDREVGNARIFCHCDKGGWWDYTMQPVEVGKAGTILARRQDFRLAWTDDPLKPSPDKDGNILAVYFSVHNSKPVNSGERIAFCLDDVRLGTWVLPVPQPLEIGGPLLRCWALGELAGAPDPWRGGGPARWAAVPCGQAVVWGAAHGTELCLAGATEEQEPVSVGGQAVEAQWERQGEGWRFRARAPLGGARSGELRVRCGEGEWSGRYVVTRPLTEAEALGLSFRTGAARLEALRSTFLAGQPLRVKMLLPAAWSGASLEGRVMGPWETGGSLTSGGRRARAIGAETILVGGPEAARATGGDYRASVVVGVGQGSVEVTCAMRVEELDRDSLLAAAEQARASAAELSRRAKEGQGEKWWAREALQTQPQVRDRERVDPAKWTRIEDPVTWEDLGGGFVGGAQCGIDDGSLQTYFEHYDFGRVIKPHLGYFLRDGWREMLEQVAARDLIVTSVWGYVPDTAWNGGFGETRIPREEHDEILRILGRHFLGYEMGEQDGRYIGSYAPRHQPATRQEAKRLFDEWHQQIIDSLHGRMIALASLNFLHDYARLGHRMLGIEASQGLPSDIMEWAFIRGASKQWGALTWNCISIFNRWGYKSYTSAEGDHGPDKGPTVELLKRLWYATYMYGSAINMFESAYFTGEKDEEGSPRLSPVGQCHVEATRWAREHGDVGVLYTPVAVMLHRDSGWVPPRHLYTGKRYLVWGNLPYARADHATDALFRLIWPQYEDCSYYEDERGFLTATPYGDVFDVILDDAPAECLARYQTILLISESGLSEPAAAERLSAFVLGGGELICDAAVARALGPGLTGVELKDQRRAAQLSVVPATGQTLEEEPYTYLVGEPRGAEALALSEHGDGILWRHRAGKGMVVTSGVPSYVAAETQDPQEGVDVPLRHKLLRAFVGVLSSHLRSLGLVEVEGAPIQYLCNVGPDPDRLLLTLSNNEDQAAAVVVSARGAGIAEADAWLGTAEVREGKLSATVPAGDVAVVELWLAR